MKKILIKAESSFLRINLKNILNKCGYAAYTTEDDDTMLEILEKEKIDLVIYDIKEKFSISIFEKISELSPDSKITISAFSFPSIFSDFLHKGFYPYIEKPISEQQIKRVVIHFTEF